MAEALLRSIDKDLEVVSAGTRPEKNINRNSVRVMSEMGIDLSGYKPKNIKNFTGENFDFFISLCDNAKSICPEFTGIVKNKIHLPFEDPADAEGTEEQILNEYRKSRDDIKNALQQLYETKIM